MKRTTRQLVFDLLDSEGDLGPTEIARRVGISVGCASGNKHRWKMARGRHMGTSTHPIREQSNTIRQRVYKLLDDEAYLTGSEIAERLGIKVGTARDARTRWKKRVDEEMASKGGAVRGPRFKKPSTKVARVIKAIKPAPAVVTLESLLEIASPKQLGKLLLTGILEALRNRDEAIANANRVIKGKDLELQMKWVELQMKDMEHRIKEVEWQREKQKLEDRYNSLLSLQPKEVKVELKERLQKKY